MARSVLIAPSGDVEVLPPGAAVQEVLEQGATCSSVLPEGSKLYWRSQTSLYPEVNGYASAVTGQTVHGDACLVNGPEPEGQDWLQQLCAQIQRYSAPTARAIWVCKTVRATSNLGTGNSTLAEQRSSTVDLTAPAAVGAVQQHPQWTALPAELVSLVALHLNATSAADVIAFSGACRVWRRALAADRHRLRQLGFRISLGRALRGCQGPRPAALLHRLACPPLPLILLKAAGAGNTSAAVAAARLLEAQGRGGEALRHWKLAARHSHPLGQYKLGQSYYLGSWDQGKDPESAMLWLSRAAKQLLDQLPLELGDLLVVLADTALLLGYLHLDGEATRQDMGEAVRWFKVAVEHGSREAERVLGHLWNTGQYG